MLIAHWHCTVSLIYIPGGRDHRYVHFTGKKVEALKGSETCLQLSSRSRAKSRLKPGSTDSLTVHHPLQALCKIGASPRRTGQLPPPGPQPGPQPLSSGQGSGFPEKDLGGEGRPMGRKVGLGKSHGTGRGAPCQMELRGLGTMRGCVQP